MTLLTCIFTYDWIGRAKSAFDITITNKLPWSTLMVRLFADFLVNASHLKPLLDYLNEYDRERIVSVLASSVTLKVPRNSEWATTGCSQKANLPSETPTSDWRHFIKVTRKPTGKCFTADEIRTNKLILNDYKNPNNPTQDLNPISKKRLTLFGMTGIPNNDFRALNRQDTVTLPISHPVLHALLDIWKDVF